MVQIVFFEVEKWESDILEKAFTDKITCTSEKLTIDNVSAYKDAEIVSPFIYSTLTAEVLAQMPKLRGIATRSTGFDHIDLSYCMQHTIQVSNVPSYGASTVAEHTFALILALSRKLVQSVDQTRDGDFSPKGLTGFSLAGKTIGVIGAGHIGKSVIHIAQAFGMHVLVFTKHQDENLPNITYVSLDDLLASSDIITLHTPLTPETKHLINMQNIELFKKGSLLINTARGGLIETQAIVDGLERGILSGAGLDVLEEECNVREERELLTSEFLKTCDLKTQLLNHVLLSRHDVLVTPHNAFNSKEALSEILYTTIDNIHGFLSGKQLHEVQTVRENAI